MVTEVLCWFLQWSLQVETRYQIHEHSKQILDIKIDGKINDIHKV